MGIIDRYIARSILIYGFTMTFIAVFTLLLERLLRLLTLAANPDKVLVYVSQMLVTLVPHYMEIALPAAFFLAVLLTFGRLQKNNEIAVLTASGIGLHRLVAPAIVLGIVLSLIGGLIASYLQPLGRYAYRALGHAVEHASLSAALREGTFVHAGAMTFFADRYTDAGERLSRVFVYESSDGVSYATTAINGSLRSSTDGEATTLILRNGQRVGIGADGGIGENIRFEEFRWPIQSDGPQAFRSRGNDERELTLPELWRASDKPPKNATVHQVSAEFHSRLARACVILILPLLAIPLALLGGRGSQVLGVVLGVITLVVFEEAVRFGESLTALGETPPGLGIWLPVGVLAGLAAYLSYQSIQTLPNRPFDRGVPDLKHLLANVTKFLKPGRGTT